MSDDGKLFWQLLPVGFVWMSFGLGWAAACLVMMVSIDWLMGIGERNPK